MMALRISPSPDWLEVMHRQGRATNPATPVGANCRQVRSPNVENSQVPVAGFVIGISSFLRISSFVIRICEECFMEAGVRSSVTPCAVPANNRINPNLIGIGSRAKRTHDGQLHL